MSNPYLRAVLFAIRNRFGRRAVGRTSLARWLSAAGLVLTVVSALIAMRPYAGALRVFLAAHETVVFSIIAAQSSLQAHLRREQWLRIATRDWLSSLPLRAGAVHAHVALRSALPAFVVPLALTMIAVSGSDRTPVTSESMLIFGSFLAAAVGAALGLWLPRRHLGSRHRRRPAAIAGNRRLRSLAPLSWWPSLVARDWLPPRLLGRTMVPIMLLIPADEKGASANVAIAVLCLWGLAWYLGTLSYALHRVVREGAPWLRPTPLKPWRFAWAVSRLALLKQIQWIIAAALLLIALGWPPAVAVRLSETWLAVVCTVTALGLRRQRSSARQHLQIAASICIIVALNQMKQHLGTLVAALTSACAFRAPRRM